MKLLHRLHINRLPWQQIIIYGLLTVLISSSYSCREKDSPVGPDTTNPATGRWVMYLSHDGVHLTSTNDTITVRVYNTLGQLTGGLEIRSTNVAESLHVGPTTNTTTDTINSPWGTTTPLVYWGYNSTVLFDTIYCTAYQNGLEVVDTSTVISLIADF